MTGPIARALGEGFESRPQQIEMASAVAGAMETKTHLLVEAGTGVGKSFAYLVPAMIRAAEHGERVVIATNTIALQEQLIEKDIPLLMSILYPEREDGGEPFVRPVLVKGRGNYVSIRRLKLASDRAERLLPDPASRRSLEVIQDWAYSTLDGTLSTLPPVERMGVWDKVQSDSANCMGRRCPNFDACFYQRARAQLENANILVCNHALFFSDLALRAQEAGFLPVYQHVVLDEAHCVEEVAADHFGLSLTEGRVQHLLNTLHAARSGRGYLAQLGLLVGDANEVQHAISLVDQAHTASRAFFDGLLDLVRKSSAASDNPFVAARGAAAGSVRMRGPGMIPNVMTPAFRDLSLRLKVLRENVKNEADRFELNAYATRAENIAVEAEALVSQLVPAAAYWSETTGGEDDGDRGGPRVTLACSPVEVAPLLKERLFAQDHSVVLTSATLATRLVRSGETGESAETAFSHVLSRLGAEGAKTLQLGSPFDYAKQVEFIIHPGVDSLSRGPDGLSPLSLAILEHVNETRGGAFVLFTSFATLNKCASECAGVMAARGYPLLAQGRDGPRGLILKRFREHEESVLFGAASFWQGVDVKGRGLRNVIITKLPFDPPDRPLTQARYELIESRGGNPFMEDSLPRAIIKFKQGFGRLIRSEEDRGRVVVLDSRLVTARYARYFLSALPEGVRPRVRGSDGDE